MFCVVRWTSPLSPSLLVLLPFLLLLLLLCYYFDFKTVLLTLFLLLLLLLLMRVVRSFLRGEFSRRTTDRKQRKKNPVEPVFGRVSPAGLLRPAAGANPR